MVSFHGDAWDADILQWLKGLDCAGECAGKDLAGVEQITGNQDEINPFGDGIGHNAAEHTEKIFVAFGFIRSGAVCFAKVDVGGVKKTHLEFNLDFFCNAYTFE